MDDTEQNQENKIIDQKCIKYINLDLEIIFNLPIPILDEGVQKSSQFDLVKKANETCIHQLHIYSNLPSHYNKKYVAYGHLVPVNTIEYIFFYILTNNKIK